MKTCPNCGSIVLEGDPYCQHCGAHFKWSYIEEEDEEYKTSSQFPYEPDYIKHDPFLDLGEVSETYVNASEETLEYIASMICANSTQKLQLKAQIREYQKAVDFKGFFIQKDYGFDVYYFHFIQENEYVKTTHVMTYRQDEYAVYNPYQTFYDSYSEHNHDKLITNPRFKKLIESTGLEFDGCGGGYESHLENFGEDVTLTGEINLRVRFKVGGKIRVYDLNLEEMALSEDYSEYDI